jgi:hypothetical protein
MLFKEWKAQPVASALPATPSERLDDAGEPLVMIDNAAVSLDLTTYWRELNERQIKEVKASRATLSGRFVTRKLNPNAKFGNRLGTTSRFAPEWRSPTHSVNAAPDDRKCSPEVKHSYMLYFDIDKEPIDSAFDLSYEIDFWNAHTD